VDVGPTVRGKCTANAESDLVEQIVGELRRQRGFFAFLPDAGQVTIHYNRKANQPVVLEFKFKTPYALKTE
jgi:hypothetical protein